MTITVAGVYEGDGVLKLEKPVNLKEHTKVNVTIETPQEEPAEDDDPTGWKAAREFIGMWKDGIPGENVGEEHDKYLYGRK